MHGQNKCRNLIERLLVNSITCHTRESDCISNNNKIKPMVTLKGSIEQD
jgi:hypothetical protein